MIKRYLPDSTQTSSPCVYAYARILFLQKITHLSLPKDFMTLCTFLLH